MHRQFTPRIIDYIMLYFNITNLRAQGRRGAALNTDTSICTHLVCWQLGSDVGVLGSASRLAVHLHTPPLYSTTPPPPSVDKHWGSNHLIMLEGGKLSENMREHLNIVNNNLHDLCTNKLDLKCQISHAPPFVLKSYY